MSDEIKYHLSEAHIPEAWYNIAADLPTQLAPPLHPGTKEPITPDMLAPIFPQALIEQEMSTERWIHIPEEVRAAYRLWRPTPLYRARNLERALDTPAKIFFKYEGASPAGSHKPNTAVPQVYYNKLEGVKRISTETGAGQWGTSLAMACNMFGLEAMVYMVKCSYYQKPYRRSMIQLWGGKVIPSPSDQTEAGRKILSEHPDSTGSLGIAISEAVEDAVKRDDTKYSLGSVLNHVLVHQSVIGLEAIKQMELAESYPDVVIGCAGGGSNLAGICFPFMKARLEGRTKTRFLAVEPAACPTLTRGTMAYDFGDTAFMTPLLKMYTLGHDFIPTGIHAGGLRYHGMGPLVSHLYEAGFIEAIAYPQNPCFEAAAMFARTELIVPAPESSHAIRAAIDEALRAKAEGVSRSILFNLSGHGHLDMAAYDDYFAGKLVDYEHPEEAIKEALNRLPITK